MRIYCVALQFKHKMAKSAICCAPACQVVKKSTDWQAAEIFIGLYDLD